MIGVCGWPVPSFDSWLHASRMRNYLRLDAAGGVGALFQQQGGQIVVAAPHGPIQGRPVPGAATARPRWVYMYVREVSQAHAPSSPRTVRPRKKRHPDVQVRIGPALKQPPRDGESVRWRDVALHGQVPQGEAVLLLVAAGHAPPVADRSNRIESIDQFQSGSGRVPPPCLPNCGWVWDRMGLGSIDLIWRLAWVDTHRAMALATCRYLD